MKNARFAVSRLVRPALQMAIAAGVGMAACSAAAQTWQREVADLGADVNDFTSNDGSGCRTYDGGFACVSLANIDAISYGIVMKFNSSGLPVWRSLWSADISGILAQGNWFPRSVIELAGEDHDLLIFGEVFTAYDGGSHVGHNKARPFLMRISSNGTTVQWCRVLRGITTEPLPSPVSGGAPGTWAVELDDGTIAVGAWSDYTLPGPSVVGVPMVAIFDLSTKDAVYYRYLLGDDESPMPGEFTHVVLDTADSPPVVYLTGDLPGQDQQSDGLVASFEVNPHADAAGLVARRITSTMPQFNEVAGLSLLARRTTGDDVNLTISLGLLNNSAATGFGLMSLNPDLSIDHYWTVTGSPYGVPPDANIDASIPLAPWLAACNLAWIPGGDNVVLSGSFYLPGGRAWIAQADPSTTTIPTFYGLRLYGWSTSADWSASPPSFTPTMLLPVAGGTYVDYFGLLSYDDFTPDSIVDHLYGRCELDGTGFECTPWPISPEPFSTTLTNTELDVTVVTSDSEESDSLVLNWASDEFSKVEAPPTCPCPDDLNDDGMLDLSDFFIFFGNWDNTLPGADVNHDMSVDLDDYFEFLDVFDHGC